MSDGHGCVFCQQQLRHRLSDDVRAADHYSLDAGKRLMDGFGQQHASQWRAWHQPGQAAGEPTRIEWVESIHIFGRIDRRDDFLTVNLFRQRQLNQNAVDFLIRVEFGNESEQLNFTYGRRQPAVDSVHTGVRYRPRFVSHVYFAGRVVPHQHDGDAWHNATVPAQTVNGIRDFASQVSRNRLAINDTRTHGLLGSFVGSRKQALARHGDFLQRRYQCWAIARNHEPFDATCSTGCQNDITPWDVHCRCNQPYQGRVGFSFACSRPNPKLEDGTRVRQQFDPVDSVTSAFGS